MNKAWLIMVNEISSQVTRSSYLLVTFGLPLLAALVVLGLSVIRGRAAPVGEELAKPAGDDFVAQGYVDQAGLLQALPDDLPAGVLMPYADEAGAQAALSAGEIEGYYLIPADYLRSGKLIFVSPEASRRTDTGQAWMVRWALLVNLLGGDTRLAERVWRPAEMTERVYQAPAGKATGSDDACLQPGSQCYSNPIVRYLPLGITVVFFVFLTSTSGLLLNSISKEKQGRIMELLITSIHPRQLLTGKILGLGLTGLLQIAIWIGGGLLLLTLAGRSLRLPLGFELPAGLLAWTVLYFLLGYGLYASLMAGAGALTADYKEANQIAWVISLPLLIGYVLAIFLAQAPNDPLPVALSILPLTAPVIMVLRLGAGGVPWWQLLLSLSLLAGTTVVSVRAIARMFRAQALLSGQPFGLRRYARALLGQP